MAKTRSMRQNQDRSTTPNGANAFTCGFFVRQRWRARGFRNLPHTFESYDKTERSKQESATKSLPKTSLKRKNRLSAISTDKAGHTVARPHHNWICKEKAFTAIGLILIDINCLFTAAKYPTKPTLPITRLGQQNKPLSSIIERSHSVISVFILTNAPNKR